MSDTKKPIFVVQMIVNQHTTNPAIEERLVRAANSAQARKFVTERSVTVVKATQDDLVRLIGANVLVEEAQDAPE